MRLAADNEAHPLSRALTRRVVAYLNIFRLSISLALLGAWTWGALIESPLFAGSSWPPLSLALYLAIALALLFETRGEGRDIFQIARRSLVLDVIVISLLCYMFGGIDSGLAVLLVFTATAAAVLLSFERALFVAALAALGLIGESIIGGYLRNGQPDELLTAGLYGLTLFVITAMTHVLARWGRDFRLIAERQMITLSRLEQINEVIIKRMRSGVLAIDRNGEIRMMNESAWFLLGSPEAAERVLAAVAPRLRAALDAWVEDPRMDSEAITLEASQAEVVPQFVALPAGREISVLIFLEDNDVVARRAVELSSQTLAKLSTSIAHEIRNPLAAVSHAAQLLAENRALGEQEMRMVDIIGKQSRRMNEIIENILQISRREKSQAELIELEPWLEEVRQEFVGAWPGHPFGLRSDDGTENSVVLFDRSQLRQVLWTLMENAVQHLGEISEPPRLLLDVAVDQGAGFCVLSVIDNGAGIPEDRIGSIFEPFFTTRKEGSGLGLFIARQLCEANQAELTVDSRPGEQTRFHIRMPLASGRGYHKPSSQQTGPE
jgi:two-component system sensor histidine kinase PilS (NtrC family)